eukprot:RCo008322
MTPFCLSRGAVSNRGVDVGVRLHGVRRDLPQRGVHLHRPGLRQHDHRAAPVLHVPQLLAKSSGGPDDNPGVQHDGGDAGGADEDHSHGVPAWGLDHDHSAEVQEDLVLGPSGLRRDPPVASGDRLDQSDVALHRDIDAVVVLQRQPPNHDVAPAELRGEGGLSVQQIRHTVAVPLDPDLRCGQVGVRKNAAVAGRHEVPGVVVNRAPRDAQVELPREQLIGTVVLHVVRRGEHRHVYAVGLDEVVVELSGPVRGGDVLRVLTAAVVGVPLGVDPEADIGGELVPAVHQGQRLGVELRQGLHGHDVLAALPQLVVRHPPRVEQDHRDDRAKRGGHHAQQQAAELVAAHVLAGGRPGGPLGVPRGGDHGAGERRDGCAGGLRRSLRGVFHGKHRHRGVLRGRLAVDHSGPDHHSHASEEVHHGHDEPPRQPRRRGHDEHDRHQHHQPHHGVPHHGGGVGAATAAKEDPEGQPLPPQEQRQHPGHRQHPQRHEEVDERGHHPAAIHPGGVVAGDPGQCGLHSGVEDGARHVAVLALGVRVVRREW